MQFSRLVGGVALAACSGSAFGQLGSINSLSTAPYWFADFQGRSDLTITDNGMAGIRFEDRNFTGSGFANRHHAALAINDTPFLFQPNQSFKFDVDIIINGPGRTEAGIWHGTAPNYPSSANADVGQFVMLPDNNGEIAAFGGRLPFFSNNQAANQDMDRAVRNETFHLTMIYTATGPSVSYGVNGVFTELLFAPGSFPGFSPNSLLGVYVQGPNGTTGDVDVTFSNLAITIPTPGSLGLLGLAGVAALRRRR